MADDLKPLLNKLISVTEMIGSEVVSLVESQRNHIASSDMVALDHHNKRVASLRAAVAQLHTDASTVLGKTDLQNEVQS